MMKIFNCEMRENIQLWLAWNAQVKGQATCCITETESSAAGNMESSATGNISCDRREIWRLVCYYTKMFHGEQKCVFLCRWHTKYVLHKSRWGSGIFYAGCIQMCVLHKSRWGSASTTLFNIVTRQVHNCNLHENIQLRPHENIFTSGALFY